MSGLRKTIKDSIISPYNKYNLSQEKLGEVIESDSKSNTCKITYKNVDGVKVIKENVPVKNQKGFFNGFPKVGDYVEVQEVGKSIRITGVVDKSQLKTDTQTSDIQSNFIDFCGHLGI